jgi:hypothetical protein
MRTNWKLKFHELEAAHEALHAQCDARGHTIASMQARIDELEAELMRLQTTHRDAVTIKDRAELMAVARKLGQQGVPCFMRGGFISHAQTTAVLAQNGVH